MDCYNLLSKKIDLIRNGKGPQFIEFSTYRWLEHCGPNYDNNIGYREEKEYLEWKKKDPILHIENLINDRKIMDELNKKIVKEVSDAFKFAEDSPFPDSIESLQGTYAE
jgi:pyruvate dehydrogenase E1 component alpha subunit